MEIWTDYMSYAGGIKDVYEADCHLFYEMTFLVSGHIRLTNGVFQAEAFHPSLIIQRLNTYHRVEAVPGIDYARYNVFFTAKALNSLPGPVGSSRALLSSDLTIINMKPAQMEMLLHYVRRLNYFADNPPVSLTLLAALFEEIVDAAENGSPVYHSSDETYIDLALKYINDHLDERLNLNKLAAHFHVCVTKFCADFKKMTMLTPAHYVRNARVYKAKYLLRHYCGHKDAVLRAALDCGFANESHFITVFRKTTGTTPGEFMKTLK